MSYTPLFTDRTDAGEKLAQKINSILQQTAASLKPPIVYALPRGGLPVAAPVARLLGCPLTIMVAKKISHPQNRS
jgi:predicted phosphoribosyltransferase